MLIGEGSYFFIFGVIWICYRKKIEHNSGFVCLNIILYTTSSFQTSYFFPEVSKNENKCERNLKPHTQQFFFEIKYDPVNINQKTFVHRRVWSTSRHYTLKTCRFYRKVSVNNTNPCNLNAEIFLNWLRKPVKLRKLAI